MPRGFRASQTPPTCYSWCVTRGGPESSPRLHRGSIASVVGPLCFLASRQILLSRRNIIPHVLQRASKRVPKATRTLTGQAQLHFASFGFPRDRPPSSFPPFSRNSFSPRNTANAFTSKPISSTSFRNSSVSSVSANPNRPIFLQIKPMFSHSRLNFLLWYWLDEQSRIPPRKFARWHISWRSVSAISSSPCCRCSAQMLSSETRESSFRNFHLSSQNQPAALRRPRPCTVMIGCVR